MNELMQTIEANKTRILDLEEKLRDYQEKCKHQDDLIKSLNTSINLIAEVSKFMNHRIAEMQTLFVPEVDGFTSASNQNFVQLSADSEILKLNESLQKKILYLESFIKEKEKYESIIQEKDQKIEELEARIKVLTDEPKILSNSQESVEPNEQITPMVFLNHPNTSLILFETNIHDPFALKVENIPGAGAGWLVIQNRFNGTVNFSGNSEKTVGTLDGEFWIGCEILSLLTNLKRHELYIELVDFDDNKAFARYDNFKVENYISDYKILSLGEYSGNAGDAMRIHEKNSFSYKSININGKSEKFWWWYGDEKGCNLNGPYYASKTKLKNEMGIWWGNWYHGSIYTLKSSKMLIRQKL